MAKQIPRIAFVCAIALLTSGCIVQLVRGGLVKQRLTDLTDNLAFSMGATANVGNCSEGSAGFTCLYEFESGSTLPVTLSILSEFGIFGVFLDPLVLELPAGATNIAGTYDDGAGTAGDLVVYPKLSFVPVDDDETLTPAPGKQLAILELPAGVPVDGVDYQFSLSFELEVPTGTGGPTEVKAMFTGKIEPSNFPGKAYYPPLLPCTSDLAAVPAITLPVVADLAVLEPLVLPAAASVCVNREYRYLQFPQICDLDNDNDVDRADISLILALRNTGADVGDPRDIDGDGLISALDARQCVVQCTNPRCA